MIDSHCHLTDAQFSEDLPAVLERARGAGVDRIVTIADTLAESEKAIVLAASHEHIFCTVGLHPHAAKEWKAGDSDRLRALAVSSPKVKGVGEIGLDYHYDHSPRDVQRAVFREQLSIAKELQLPAVVHCREAVEDIWTIVSEVQPLKMVIHCCTERFPDVERFVKQGYFLSFTGIATYPKSEEIRWTIRNTPITQMMIETDAPYLAPVPHRGKRNEPAFVAEVLTCVADIKGLSVAEAERALTANTVAFFGLPA
jgi:TatD DNase family protein